MDRPIPLIILMLCVMLTILGSTLFYVGRKLFRWLCVILPNVNPRFFIIIPVIIALSFIFSFLPVNPGIKKYLVWLNFCFVGIVLYFLAFFVLSDAVLIIGRLTKLIPAPIPKQIVMAIGCIVTISVTLTTAYGIYSGKQLKKVLYSIEIEKNTSLKNLNIALISDTHLGYLNNEKWLSKIADNINALEPDIVCIAGDIFNDNFNAMQNPEEAAGALRRINSKYGVYAVFGNHDGGDTFGEMLGFLEQGNVKVLQDEYAAIENIFIILGRTESSPIGKQGAARKDLADIMAEIGANADIRNLPIIALDHNPANLKEYENKIDLFLAGHTHSGQIFPANIITKLIYKEINYGYSKMQNSPHAVVTSGAGLWGPPLRIGTNNEVVKIEVSFR